MAAGLTQEELAAKLQLAGLHSADRVTVAKIESQIRSVFDFELAVIAKVLGTDPASLMPTPEKLKGELDSRSRSSVERCEKKIAKNRGLATFLPVTR